MHQLGRQLLWYIFSIHTTHRTATSIIGPVGPSSTRNCWDNSSRKKTMFGSLVLMDRQTQRRRPPPPPDCIPGRHLQNSGCCRTSIPCRRRHFHTAPLQPSADDAAATPRRLRPPPRRPSRSPPPCTSPPSMVEDVRARRHHTRPTWHI
jgi:hypothetical protein